MPYRTARTSSTLAPSRRIVAAIVRLSDNLEACNDYLARHRRRAAEPTTPGPPMAVDAARRAPSLPLDDAPTPQYGHQPVLHPIDRVRPRFQYLVDSRGPWKAKPERAVPGVSASATPARYPSPAG
ncbi:hypothetical protein GCM10023175_58770 [Pseudonocardia xishanensis]|uniref:Uncharacterized protein n=1 Tax=Pseudonocardia xishanensis TaxID=630995 RepID=A0ABP8S134_9PSEU